MDKSYTELALSNENMKEYILTLEENIADIEEKYSELQERYYELKDKYELTKICCNLILKNNEEFRKILEENGLAEEIEESMESEVDLI